MSTRINHGKALTNQIHYPQDLNRVIQHAVNLESVRQFEQSQYLEQVRFLALSLPILFASSLSRLSPSLSIYLDFKSSIKNRSTRIKTRNLVFVSCRIFSPRRNSITSRQRSTHSSSRGTR